MSGRFQPVEGLLLGQIDIGWAKRWNTELDDVPIDPDFRREWMIVDSHSGHSVWKLKRKDTGTIHGTRVGVHIESCVACMKCVTACPTSVLVEWEDEVNHQVVDPAHESDCIECLICELVCPADAIHVEREHGSEATLDSLLRRP